MQFTWTVRFDERIFYPTLVTKPWARPFIESIWNGTALYGSIIGGTEFQARTDRWTKWRISWMIYWRNWATSADRPMDERTHLLLYDLSWNRNKHGQNDGQNDTCSVWSIVELSYKRRQTNGRKDVCLVWSIVESEQARTDWRMKGRMICMIYCWTELQARTHRRT